MASGSDSDEDETFIKLGTPLPERDDDEPRRKPVSMQDIQARDFKGRPRFHGAFTGGFSAGYFNTVGSKEGWTPSTFVSSRSKKTEVEVQQRPEDFMDEEDFSEHGIAPRKLVTAGQFTSEERKKRRLDEAKAATQDAAIPGVPALVDLIIPERISIGVKLLRKMGWKEGQGLGPRLSTRQRRLQKSGKKIYGCALPPTSSSEEDDIDDSAVLKDVTFAPRDIMPVHLLAKDNTHGLGYRGLDPQSALPSSHVNLFGPPAVTKTGRKGIRGQAFGVGALEDEDEDIYGTDHISNYDVTMGDAEDDNFGWTAPKHKGKIQIPVGYVGKMLEGFKLSSTPLIQKKHFPPPTLPRTFRPVHVFRKPEEENQSASWFLDTGRQRSSQFRKPDDLENQSGHGPLAKSREKPQFTDAVSRGIALGEQPFVGSVFDLIPKEDKRKMEAAKQGVAGTSASGRSQSIISKEPASQTPESSTLVQKSMQPDCTTPSEKPVHSAQNRKPNRGQQSQKAALISAEEQRRNNVPLFQAGAGFKPFAKDPDKQERYEKYLALVKQGHRDPYSSVVMPGQTEWETEKEREEFSRAAKLYKPLAGMMAMRFTTGKHQDDDTHVDVKVEEAIDKCDATKAAEMKMFGKLTRDVLQWHPDRLVCKRFNIPDPYPGSSIIGLATVKRDKFSVFNFLTFPSQQEASQEQLRPLPDSFERSSGSSGTVSKTDVEKQESKVEKELNKSKSMKSIFSHLVETENETQKKTKGLSFSVKSVNTKKPKEFKSIFSHLEDSEDKPKRKLIPMEIEEPQSGTNEREADESTNQEKESNTVKSLSSQTEQKPAEEEKPEMDLFRAIFRNTDSEESSSSDEEEEEKQTAVSDKRENDESSPRATSVINTREERQSSLGKDQEKSSSYAYLPGSGELIPTLKQRLSPRIEEIPSPSVAQDQSEDEYGPALPPALPSGHENNDFPGTTEFSKNFVDLTESSRSSKKHKHHGHKSKKDKKEKHKKSKHRKKGKKKEKKKKDKREKSSSESEDTSAKETDSEDSSTDIPSDKDILKKMKTLLPGQRLRAVDFM